MNRLSVIVLLVAAFVFAATAPALARAETAADIVARVRESLGLAKLKGHGAMRLAGTTSLLGNPSTAELIFDASGRSLLTIKGPINASWGYDGTTAWITDFAGETRQQWFHEREDIILRTLIISGLAFAEGSDRRFTLDDARSTNDVVSLAFTLDDKTTAGHVGIDRDRWRPVAWITYNGPHKETWELYTFVTVSGVTLPINVIHTAEYTFHPRFTFTSLGPIKADPERFAMPPVAFTDVRFDPAAPAAIEIKRARPGHLLAKVTLDDLHEGWFIFDTGAGMNSLGTAAIEEHGYKSIARVPVAGVGGVVGGPLVRPKSLRIGAVTLDQPLCMGIDLTSLSRSLGENLSGVIGYSLLARCIAEIDMNEPAIRLHDPAKFTLERGQWSPLTLADRVPGLEGAIEGHAGIFKLDTGAANSTLSIHAPAVVRFKLLEGRETQPTTIGGIGGPLTARTGIVKLFQIAGTRCENFTADFVTESKGSFSDGRSLGNVGGRILANFTLVLDYQNNRAALVPRE